MKPTVKVLRRRLDRSVSSEDCVRTVRALARTADPAAVPVLASLLECPGAVGRAAVQALLTFPRAVVEPAMRECLEALEEEIVRNAYRVLAAFGDVRSRRAMHAVCWADFEESERIDAEDKDVA
jgi:hypothetical protein